MADSVVTRFAPSPTGALHVGGARTALFNWAYARRHGGRFLLRIEDTDLARSTEASERGILEDLRWLGLDWNNQGSEPRQSQRLDQYNAAVEKLMADGRAYDDDGAVRFRMPDHDLTVHDEVLGEVTVKAGEIEDFVIRKGEAGGRMPTYHLAVVVDDADMAVTHVIRGQEHLNNAPKHVALQQALGLPTPHYAHIPLIFNPDGSKMSKRDKIKYAQEQVRAYVKAGGSLEELANRCVDRADRVRDLTTDPIPPVTATHIIDFPEAKPADLGDVGPVLAECISYELGFDLPEIEVSDFKWSGYLPEALSTYLALLGWNPGGEIDEQQITREYLAKHFDLARVGKSNARFDRDKLAAFNSDAVKSMPVEQFAQQVWHLPQNARVLSDFPGFVDDTDQRFIAFCETYRERSKTVRDPLIQGWFFFASNEEVAGKCDLSDKNIAKAVTKGQEGNRGCDYLRQFLPILENCPQENFGAAAHEALQKFCAERELNMGKVAQPIRVAVSGSTVTPPIDATLEILGKEATVARIRRLLEHVGVE